MQIELYLNRKDWVNESPTMQMSVEPGFEQLMQDWALCHATHSKDFGALVVNNKIVHLHCKGVTN